MDLNPLTYALIAQEAYSADPDIGKADSSGRAIIRPTIDGTAFGFPGTNNLACWLADLDIITVETLLGELHKGFNDSVQLILGDVKKQAAISAQPIILTGHSEGAALAQIIAGYLCLVGRPPLAVFALESPRVTCGDILGNILKANKVQVTITKKGNDLVPMIPRLGKWRHIAPLTEIGTAILPVPNIEDHAIGGVVDVIRAQILASA